MEYIFDGLRNKTARFRRVNSFLDLGTLESQPILPKTSPDTGERCDQV